MASGNTLLITYRTGATWRAAVPSLSLFLLLGDRVRPSLPDSSETCVFGCWASTVLENGFPVVFEFEFEQIQASTDYSEHMAFSGCTVLKCDGNRQSFGAFLREGSMVSPLRLSPPSKRGQGWCKWTQGCRTGEGGLSTRVQPGPCTEQRRHQRPKAGLPLSPPSWLWKAFNKDNFHGF